MSLGRKKQKTQKKKARQRGGRKTLKKNNKTKSRKHFQIGGSIKPIMGNLLYILENDEIEFLPSSKLLEIDTTHYLKMIDYHKLESIIDNNPEYKNSPTIQELFNYEAIDIDENNKISFDTSKIKCNDILDKTHRTYFLRVLFFYLLECNVIRDPLQTGGAEGDKPEINILSKKEELKLGEPPTEPKEEKKKEVTEVNPNPILEKPPPEPNPLEKKETPQKGLKMDIPEEKSQIVDEPIPENEELLDNEDIREEQELVNEDEGLVDLETIEIEEQQQLPGFTEYEKLRDRLELNDEMVKDTKKISLTESNFVFYNVNWFDVSLGMKKLDILYEDKVSDELKNIGLNINEDKLKEKVEELLKDDFMKKSFKSAIYKRLLDCSKKPQSLIDRILKRVSFESCIKCDLRDKGSILYLHDEYRALINQNTSAINKIDLTIIIIVCEIRQRLLSYHIAMEVLRRNTQSKSVVEGLLKKIYKIDLPLIKAKTNELNQRREKMMEDTRRRNEENQQLILEQKAMQDKNELLREKFNENMDESQIERFKEKFSLDNNENKDFIDKMNKSLDEEIEEEMRGGSEIVDQKQMNDNILSELYNMNNLKNKNRCESIKNNHNIYLDDLQYLNNCDNL